jgi:hypothetical protein
MKVRKIILLFLGIALFFGIPVQKIQAQQPSASISAQVFAEVIAGLTATETSQLNFGRFAPQEQGGQVHISPQGVRYATGTLALSGGTFNPASFHITGEDGASFSINLPTAPSVLTNVASSKTMQVSDWVSDPPAGKGAGILHGGSLAINVGATLSVGNMNDNPIGIYSGTYSIVFAYD